MPHKFKSMKSTAEKRALKGREGDIAYGIMSVSAMINTRLLHINAGEDA
jgi:hypothetical protein